MSALTGIIRPLSALALLLALTLAPAPPASAREVTHGPILGRPGAHSMGVWVRTSEPGPFRVRYGTEPQRLAETPPGGETRLERDNTGWIEISGLRANTRYYYELILPGQDSAPERQRGSFRTLPDGDDFRHPVHNPRGLFNFAFEFACGNSQGRDPNPPVFRTMLDRIQDKIQFAIQNGDWHYEEKRDYAPEAWSRQVGVPLPEAPRVVQIAPTIAGVWENYKLYLERSRNLSDWHRQMPSLFTFDDHEILGDVNGAGTIGLRSRRAVFRDIGVQAWYDYLGWSNPVPHTQGIHFGRAELRAGSGVLTDPEADFRRIDLNQASNLHVHWGEPTAGVNFYDRNDINHLDRTGGDPNAGVYEIVEVIDANRLRIRPAPEHDGEAAYSIGRYSYFHTRQANAGFFFLDTRSHRQIHNPDNPHEPGRSMIGEKQKAWLKEGMRGSDADFLFVISSVNLMIPHVGPGAGGAGKDEAWTALASEREELIRFWDSLDQPVFVLTGDLHNSFAIRITENVWEFASGPHNSGNHPATSEDNRPPNGQYVSRGRECDIRWSSYFLEDARGPHNWLPVYCVVQVNNVFPNPSTGGEERWVAFPRPQVVFQYYHGLTGDLLYAESILAPPRQ